MEKENRTSILSAIDSRTKLIGLIALIAEALFLGSLATLPSEQRLYSLLACAFILVVCILGIIYVEAIVEKSNTTKTPLNAHQDSEESFASSQETSPLLNIPDELRKELALSYLVKKDQLSDEQRKILRFIEERTKNDDSVNQKELETTFSEHMAQVYVYWRLEHLRLLGFITKSDTGDRRYGKPVFGYALSSEYRTERSNKS